MGACSWGWGAWSWGWGLGRGRWRTPEAHALSGAVAGDGSCGPSVPPAPLMHLALAVSHRLAYRDAGAVGLAHPVARGRSCVLDRSCVDVFNVLCVGEATHDVAFAKFGGHCCLLLEVSIVVLVGGGALRTPLAFSPLFQLLRSRSTFH